jgi:hypothetical protein
MVLKYHISPYPALEEPMWVRIWEAESDGVGAHVYEEELADPHDAPRTITVNGLDKVVHIVRLYTDSGTLLHEYNAEPKTDLIEVFDPIRFKIGDGGEYTPPEGTSVFSHPLLVGLADNEFIIHRNNYGELFPGIHYTNDEEGAWTLEQEGDVFNENEEFTIRLQPKVISTTVNDSVVGKWFGGFVDVSASRDYLATDLRKLIRLSGSPTYTFPALGAVPIGYIFIFTGFGTAAGTGVVQFLNAPLKWKNTTKTTFSIEDYCTAAFVFDGTVWNVVWITASAEAVGAGPVAGDILGSGEVVIGDLPPNDPLYTVTHDLAISGNYRVWLSAKTTDGGNRINNNLICLSWMHHTTDKPNKFLLTPQEIDHVVNSITICWLITKA